ncbi:MAG TPA: diguanylate cyclase [Gammaproteobacteria bacterium]|nr:diguanylate cyclase [Gammaproteobacteria bacterium]
MPYSSRNNRLTVYADLNCPFCYALHEHLQERNSLPHVAWQCIEHAPQVHFDTQDVNAATELKTEVAKVKILAPDTIINVPPGRPNTRLANEILAEVLQQAPHQADILRSRFYRALWVDGRDIGDPAIIDEILHSLNIPRPGIGQQTHEILQHWQNQWEHGDFSRNIPALITAEGNKLLGLPSQQLLTLFIFGDSVNISAESDAICTLQPREHILLVSPDPDLRQHLQSTLEDYELHFCEDSKTAIDICLSAIPPDLVLLDNEANGMAICEMLSEHNQGLIIPIILLSNQGDEQTEISAFEKGAADFIHKDTSVAVLRARIRTLLRLKRANDLLDEVAHMDPLTEIPNRREYNRVIDLEWRQGIRTQKPLSVILLDIDYFKKYNDNYGHIAGDQCLRRFAQFLQRNIRRPTDLLARYGGEEFVIILPDTDEAGALKVAQLVKQELAAIEIPHNFSPIAKHLTVTQGVASCLPGLDGRPDQLLKSADHALYAAKAQGRNQIVCAGSLE